MATKRGRVLTYRGENKLKTFPDLVLKTDVLEWQRALPSLLIEHCSFICGLLYYLSEQVLDLKESLPRHDFVMVI